MPILAEVARDVVTQFPELKLSRTLWVSGEQRPKIKANLGYWKRTIRASRGFNGFTSLGTGCPPSTHHTHTLCINLPLFDFYSLGTALPSLRAHYLPDTASTCKFIAIPPIAVV